MFSARMIRKDPPVAQAHREEEAEIGTISLTRRTQTEEEAHRSKSQVVMPTIQMNINPDDEDWGDYWDEWWEEGEE